MLDHADGGDDAVERKHGVENHDLHEDLPEDGMLDRTVLALGVPFETLVQFHRSLEQQEQTAEDQNEVTS